jgi:hypothetical protein
MSPEAEAGVQLRRLLRDLQRDRAALGERAELERNAERALRLEPALAEDLERVEAWLEEALGRLGGA